MYVNCFQMKACADVACHLRSTQQDDSSLGVLKVMLVLQAVRSSSIAMVVGERTAEEPSRAKTFPKSIGRQRTLLAGLVHLFLLHHMF